MAKYCTECGAELEGDYKFCPECGTKTATVKKGKKTEKVKKEEEVEGKKEEKKEEVDVKSEKEEKKKKPAKFKLKLPSYIKKMPKKTGVLLLAIICIVVVVVAAVIYINPLGNMNGSVGPGGGRTFTVTVRNDFNQDAECYLLIDNLRQGISGEPGFTVNASEETVITIIEDDLLYQRSSYPIRLFVSMDNADGYPDSDLAPLVNASAEFVIDMVDGQIYDFFVECTAYS